MEIINKNAKYFFIGGKILVALVFLYFGIEGIFSPETFSYLIPDFISRMISADFVVMLHGGVEVVCSVLIILNVGKFWPYVVLIASFLGVLFSVSGTILIRDVGIFGALLLLLSSQATCGEKPQIES